ncbi:hypothetical protein PVT68_12815 [Microbulbifer bruguierae]|uniref:Secreted protein n=1 Tax=Microbulbifer bruguierae TaxID=3029061 RepID=A0ABY8NDX2_9GAMM|nr:hypothetical protein [Microbulbifer bruguierae]WGL15648.1 hypothetical protein PVT68_12815 [Microbulbifer bruguierae]
MSHTSHRGIRVQKLSFILLAAAIATGNVAGCTSTESRDSHATRAFSSAVPPHLDSAQYSVRSSDRRPRSSRREAPRSLNVNGTRFRCFEQELDSKTVVRCVRQDS